MSADFIEQRPGEQPAGFVGYREKQLYTVDPNWPCSMCHHKHGEHRFLYGIGIKDRYRCEVAGCKCGESYLATAVFVRPDQIDTEEKRMELMKRLSEANQKEKDNFQP